MPLVTEILRGIQDTFEAEHPDVEPAKAEMARGMARAAMLHDLPASVSSIVQASDKAACPSNFATQLRMHDGSLRDVDLSRSVMPDGSSAISLSVVLTTTL